MTAAPAPRIGKVLRAPVFTGLAVLVIFFGGLAFWSWAAPLSGATIASGAISPEGYRRTIQHLEGGIVEAIAVRDGDQVVAGAPLVTLRDLQARAQYDQLSGRDYHLAALEARLEAEQDRRRDWWPETDNPNLVARVPSGIVASQQEIFAIRQTHLDEQQRILQQRIEQLHAQIAGLHEQIDAQDEQLSLIAQEVASVEDLLEQGLERMPRLLALQRQSAEIAGSRAVNVASIATAELRIGETELELINLETNHLQSVGDQLVEVRAERASIQEELTASSDVLDRTVITAPISGTVVGLQTRTTGGVVGPGEPILDIVPADEDLLIEARVALTDIDTVSIGQPARIVLSAYPQRNIQPLEGEVVALSADSVSGAEGEPPFYAARVRVHPDELSALPQDILLRPGMPTEVFITTDGRTVVDYLLSPLTDTLRRAFRED
ncbi:MAG: HlyD family type I secretion periplasmic adaptor subunit [Pseudomonadota bacterium]